jgi:hypothetical protein
VKSRSEQLRERQRRVFRWSLGIAILLHGALFAFVQFRTEPLAGWDEEEVAEASPGEGRPFYVEVVFGPPEITRPGGGVVREDRQLEADRTVLLPPGCGVLAQTIEGEPHGRVRLRVRRSGRTDVVEVTQSTGSACGDEVVRMMAGALWYHWLPNERFPAPVDLIQPVTLLLPDE